MAVIRFQAVCVGMWRGKIKRWNTTFHVNQGTVSVETIGTAMKKAGYPNPGDAVGACSGGVASVTAYWATGGPPIQEVTYFDWQTPSTWIPYTGEAWAGITAGTPIDASGESAAIVVGHLPGLSVTGKPTQTRKYLHAIPSRTAVDYADPDIDATVAAALANVFPASLMANEAGVVPSSVEALTYYGNHQRVRGRRRTVRQVAGQAFSLGVLAGGGATTSGQGDPFPGGEF